MSDTPDAITIDGFGPLPVARPASVAELCDLVRRCAAEGQAVYPVGGGTMLDYGLPPTKPGLAIDTRALDQVTDYPARDMTITVQAGITVAKLREVTRAEGLDLPIDVPDPDRATLGGAITCNVSGPRRYGYGTFRDYVLGITTVNDRGEAVSAGGRVVKNVAGYDLMKLHTGALGTLGVITQVTLKLRPVPEAAAILSITGNDFDRLESLLTTVHQSRTRPVCFELHAMSPSEDRSRPADWYTRIGYEGTADAIGWQVETAREELALFGGREAKIHKDRGDWCVLDRDQHVITELPGFRASLRPSAVAAFCRRVVQDLGPEVELLARAGSGVVYSGYWLQTTLDQFRSHLASMLNWIADSDGNIIIERCPTEWKKSLPVWGRPPADLVLQKAIKRALDPNHLFNPGRFVTDT
jgi:glycolate oxidase FAD binding subunit